MLGFEKALEKTITPMAVKKRRAIEESNKKNSTWFSVSSHASSFQVNILIVISNKKLVYQSL